VATWKFSDGHTGQQPVRYIWYYDTLMGCYYGVTLCDSCAADIHHGERECRRDPKAPNLAWVFEPIGIGHGNVSDQNGMNEIMMFRYAWNPITRTREFTQDYRHTYHRDIKGGGPRITNNNTGEVVLP
jgi:hypothetical protein